MAKKVIEKEGMDDVFSRLEKKYGMGVDTNKDLVIVSTGSIQLDQAMKIGGTPLGKMIELIGNESSGKTTTVLHQMAEYQKAFPDRRVVYLDMEHSFSPTYARAIGVDLEKLKIYQPSSMEEAYNLAIDLIKSDLVSCIVVDSQTAAIPKAVIDGEMGDSTIALQARINSKFCLKVKGLLDIHAVTLFFVSQVRANVGSMSGDGLVSTGGYAIKFYSDVRWKIWKIAKKDDELNLTTIDVVKSKVGNPFGQAKISILWGTGYDKVGEVIDYASEMGIIQKAGAGWFTIEGTKLQGMDKVRAFLDDNPGLLEEITKKVMKGLETPIIGKEEEEAC